MEERDIISIINIRSYLIECHNALDGKASSTTALIKQVDVANRYSYVIKMIDKLLSEKGVKFENR